MTFLYRLRHAKYDLRKFGFWATVCKTIRRLSCQSCLTCLSVTLLYCGQTVGWIKMKLGMEVGLVPGHIVLDGEWDPAPPPPKWGTTPNFRPKYCGQMAGWIKIPLGTKESVGSGDIVLYGDPAPPKGVQPPSQFLAHVYCIAKRSPILATAEHL